MTILGGLRCQRNGSAGRHGEHDVLANHVGAERLQRGFYHVSVSDVVAMTS